MVKNLVYIILLNICVWASSMLLYLTVVHSFSLLYNIPWCQQTTIYLSILLIMSSFDKYKENLVSHANIAKKVITKVFI